VSLLDLSPPFSSRSEGIQSRHVRWIEFFGGGWRGGLILPSFFFFVFLLCFLFFFLFIESTYGRLVAIGCVRVICASFRFPALWANRLSLPRYRSCPYPSAKDRARLRVARGGGSVCARDDANSSRKVRQSSIGILIRRGAENESTSVRYLQDARVLCSEEGEEGWVSLITHGRVTGLAINEIMAARRSPRQPILGPVMLRALSLSTSLSPPPPL